MSHMRQEHYMTERHTEKATEKEGDREYESCENRLPKSRSLFLYLHTCVHIYSTPTYNDIVQSERTLLLLLLLYISNLQLN